MHGTILCGITDTAEARAAAQLAAALAARLRLRLVLVHVTGQGGRVDAEVERALAGIRHELDGVAETRTIPGNRVDALAQAAADEGADLIVLGARRHGARGGLRCTLARQLEAAQPVPVLIAPPATRARSGRRLALAQAPQGR